MQAKCNKRDLYFKSMALFNLAIISDFLIDLSLAVVASL